MRSIACLTYAIDGEGLGGEIIDAAKKESAAAVCGRVGSTCLESAIGRDTQRAGIDGGGAGVAVGRRDGADIAAILSECGAAADCVGEDKVVGSAACTIESERGIIGEIAAAKVANAAASTCLLGLSIHELPWLLRMPPKGRPPELLRLIFKGSRPAPSPSRFKMMMCVAVESLVICGSAPLNSKRRTVFLPRVRLLVLNEPKFSRACCRCQPCCWSCSTGDCC